MAVPESLRFVIKRHAERPYLKLSIKYADGTAFDLTSATGVAFLMYDSDGIAKVSAAGSVVGDPTDGIIQYVWASGDLDTAGDFVAEFDVDFSGETLTLPLDGTIGVKVYEDVNDG